VPEDLLQIQHMTLVKHREVHRLEGLVMQLGHERDRPFAQSPRSESERPQFEDSLGQPISVSVPFDVPVMNEHGE
jgi:hypothetical protein